MLQTVHVSDGTSFSIYADAQDDVWLNGQAAVPQGIYFLDTKNNKVLNFSTSSNTVKLNNNAVRTIVQANDGNIWLGTDHGGINVIDKKDFSITYMQNQEDNPESLPQNSIYYLYNDNAGLIWAGTYKKGVGYYDKNNLAYVGHSGGGYKESEMPAILSRLKKLETRNKPFAGEVETPRKSKYSAVQYSSTG